MNKWLLSLLLVFTFIFNSLPASAITEKFNKNVYVISSSDICDFFYMYPKYRMDGLMIMYHWEALPGILEEINKRVGNGPLYLDFMVHGEYDGLYIHSKLDGVWRRTSFGYVINQIKKYIKTKDLTVTFESCFAGAAYKNTIRNNKMQDPGDIIEDCLTVPTFPIYGPGVNYANIGPIMYVQVRYNFQRILV